MDILQGCSPPAPPPPRNIPYSIPGLNRLVVPRPYSTWCVHYTKVVKIYLKFVIISVKTQNDIFPDANFFAFSDPTQAKQMHSMIYASLYLPYTFYGVPYSIPGLCRLVPRPYTTWCVHNTKVEVYQQAAATWHTCPTHLSHLFISAYRHCRPALKPKDIRVQRVCSQGSRGRRQHS